MDPGPNTVTVTTPRGTVTPKAPMDGIASVPRWNDDPWYAMDGTPITTYDNVQIVAYPP